MLLKAQSEAEQQMRELQDELRDLRRMLEHTRQPLDVLKTVEDRLETLEEAVERPVERKMQTVGERLLQRAVRLGDKVRLKSLNTQGVVTTLGEEEAEVQVGMLRVRARLSDLTPVSGAQDQAVTGEQPELRKVATRTTGEFSFFGVSPGLEVDLRGKRAEDALDALERYLDAAYLAGLPFVRIIHGKGTGKLRQAVRETLSSHPHVKSFESGGEKEGGEGVTVAKLAVG